MVSGQAFQAWGQRRGLCPAWEAPRVALVSLGASSPNLPSALMTRKPRTVSVIRRTWLWFVSANSTMNDTVCLLVACLTSQQQASVSQGRICSDNLTCCHTEIEVADQTFYLTQSQYTDTGPTSPSADPNAPGALQGSHWSANFEVSGMTRPRKNPGASGIRTRDLPLLRRAPYH